MSTTSKHVEQGLTITGFYGTLTFTALVLVLSFPERWKFDFYGIPGDLYIDALVTLLAGISSIYVLTTFGYFLLSNTDGAFSLRMNKLVKCGFYLCQSLLLIVFPTILYPFTRYGSIIAAVVEAGFVVGIMYAHKGPKSQGLGRTVQGA